MKPEICHLTTGIACGDIPPSSCEDFLNKEPLSNVIPSEYYLTADQIPKPL